MRSLLTASTLLTLALTASAQTTWYVDVNNPPPGSGTMEDPYASIQYAIDKPSTLPADTVLVLPGVYAENLDLHGKILILRSQQGPGATILDGGGIAPVIRLQNLDLPGTLVEGFTLQNGYGLIHGGPSYDLYGGGMFCTNCRVEVVDCQIRANHAILGCGVFMDNTQASFTNCAIDDNLCGGGLLAYASMVVLNTTSVSGNTDYDCCCGGYGTTAALIVRDSTLVMEDCLVEGNRGGGTSGIIIDNSKSIITHSTIARNGNYPSGTDRGGGVSVWGGSLTVADSVFQDNWNERRGGAIAAFGATVEVERCTLRGNKSTDSYWGGAIYTDPSDPTNVLTVRDCEFVDGYSGGGSGLFIGAGTAIIDKCLIMHNRAHTSYYEEGSGAGIWVNDGASAMITECVLEDNLASGDSGHGGRGAGIYVRPQGAATIRRSAFLRNYALKTENYFAMDSGRGGAVYGPAYLENCTISQNMAEDDEEVPGQGGGAFGGTLNSCIIWKNLPESLAGGALADWSDIEGGWSGMGNFDMDPLFWGLHQGDLHLLPGSPCIDSGDRARTDDDGSRVDVGAYPFNPTYCGGPSTYCEAKVNSLGCVSSIGWSGTPTLTGADDFHVLATNIIPSKVGILLWSTSGSADTPFFGGTLCVAPPHHRAPRLFSGGQDDGACDGAFDFHFSHSYMQGQGLTIGSRLFLQFWYRDPMHSDGTGTGLTDGLAATICLTI